MNGWQQWYEKNINVKHYHHLTRAQGYKPEKGVSNIYWNGNKYYITQRINGKNHYYGTYNTLEEAVQKRDELIQQGVITERRGRKIKNYENRYVYPYAGRYIVRKVVNKKQEHFGTFKTLEEARAERDYLESIDWDYSNME